MQKLQRHFTELIVIYVETKRNEVQPGKVSFTPSSVQKAMSSGGYGNTEVMAHPWRLVEDCSMHVQLPWETRGRRASSVRY